MDRSTLDQLDLSRIPDRGPNEDEVLMLVVVRRDDPPGEDSSIPLLAPTVAFGTALAAAAGTTPERVHFVIASTDAEMHVGANTAELAQGLEEPEPEPEPEG